MVRLADNRTLPVRLRLRGVLTENTISRSFVGKILRTKLTTRSKPGVAFTPRDTDTLTLCTTTRILVDPTSNIRLSQRLSHACLSTNRFNVKPHKAQYNSYNLQDHLPSYLDNCGKSRANTCKMQEPRGTCAIISQTNRPP